MMIAVLGLVMSAWAQDLVEVYQIDFGPKKTCAPGYIAIEDRSDDIRFAWKGKDLNVRDRGGPDPVKRDLVFVSRPNSSPAWTTGTTRSR